MTNETPFPSDDDDEFEALWARAESSKAGKYISMLSAKQLRLLDEFTEEVLVEEHSEASVKSYRSYIAKAMALPTVPLTNDQKSAVRKFRRWMQG
jgi:hypothetical protein